MIIRCDHCGGSVINWDGNGLMKCIMCGRKPGVRLLTPEEADAARKGAMREKYARGKQ